MFYYLLLTVILSSPSELIKKAAESNNEDNFKLAQQYIDSAKGSLMNDFEQAKLFDNQGFIFQEQNRPAEALLQYHESLRYLKSSGKDSDHARYMLTWINSNMATIYYDYSNYELASQYYDEALKHATHAEKSTLFYYKAFSLEKEGEIDAAIENLLAAFESCVDEEQHELKANIQIRIGALLNKAEKYQSASEYFSKVVALDSLPVSILAKAYNNYAISSWKMSDYATAETQFEKVLNFGDSHFQFVALQNLCEMYLEQRHFLKSIKAGIRAEALLDDQRVYPENLKLYSYLSSAYEGFGDQSNALQYARIFNTQMISYYQDQENLIDVEQANRIKMITENYEWRVEQLEERRVTIMINIFISSIILLTFLGLIWRQKTKKEKMVKKIEEELLA